MQELRERRLPLSSLLLLLLRENQVKVFEEQVSTERPSLLL